MEGYRSGHNGAVLKTVRAQAHMGSNPILSAIKKTSFVDCRKRGFLVVFGGTVWYDDSDKSRYSEISTDRNIISFAFIPAMIWRTI